MYGYIYKTTNLISKKIYIGQKKSDKFLGNKYLGSGKKLLDAIKSYGVDKFKVELIEEIDKLEDMDTREIYWIKYYNATNKDVGYNLSEGGRVNRTLVGENNPNYGKHLSEEMKMRLSKSIKYAYATTDARQKLSENAKNNPNYGLKGKRLSEETKINLVKLKKEYLVKLKVKST